MANKISSEPDNRSNRSRPAPAALSSERRADTSDSLSQSLSSGGDATSKVIAADIRSAGAIEENRDPRYEEIAEAAYHRFLRRGGQDGGDVDDWVEAERDLRHSRSR